MGRFTSCIQFKLLYLLRFRGTYVQWWIFKIGGLRQNSNKGSRRNDVAINNCDQTTVPSTMLHGRLQTIVEELMRIHSDIFIIKAIR